MTTMFCRLLLCDLFVHGIGGAKYDQLTDLIASRFLGIRLPEYGAITATLRLPTGATDVLPGQLNETRNQLRNLEFHPEKYIDLSKHPEARPVISSKSDWVHAPTDKNRQSERHQAIAGCNQCLRHYVQPLIKNKELQLRELPDEIRRNRILGSRDYSFCLFPGSLVEELQSML